MKKIGLITMGFFCSIVCIYASGKNNLDSAKFYYKNKNYEKAINFYTLALKKKPNNPQLHYNIANCYYKNNKNTLAIFHYEKSLKLLPNNKDASYNLSLAEKKTIDKIEGQKNSPIINFFNTLILKINLNNLLFFITISLFISLAGFGIFFLSNKSKLRKIGFYSGFTLFVMALIFSLQFYFHHNLLYENKYAIIIEPVINVVNEPSQDAKTLFSLHEGTKVKILNNKKNYAKIILPNKNQGWIDTSGIKNI